MKIKNWKITCLFTWNNICLFTLFSNLFLVSQADTSHHHQRCSNRLEAALKNTRRRGHQPKTARLLSETSPYDIYHSIYGQQRDPDSDKKYDAVDRAFHAKQRFDQRGSGRPQSVDSDAYGNYSPAKQPYKAAQSPRVEVEDLRVKLPQSVSSRWVEVDKCKFSTENSTLDTRLIFPDLTISGRVILQPNGEKCSMILRLRRAGIEFRTTPIGFENFGNEESRRIGSASVRTDSHFAEPGFISVFAHSCQLATGNKLRRNSKRRFGHTNANALSNLDVYSSTPHLVIDGAGNRRPAYHNERPADHTLNWDTQMRRRDSPSAGRRFIEDAATRRPHRRSDQLSFNDDVLNAGEDFQHFVEADARAFADDFRTRERGSGAEADDVLAKEMELLFSMGVKGLLTTYMQKSLQPAIKETLMENMGYTLSYG